MKKRIYPVLFALALALSGCGAKPAEDGVYTIGICQLVTHDALDAATEGFKAALTEKLGDKVSFEASPASGEIFKCWKKNGVIVSTDETYEFFAWKDATVEAVYVTENFTFSGIARKILIDTFATGGKSSVMAEFIGFENEDVIEKLEKEKNKLSKAEITTVATMASGDVKPSEPRYRNVGDTADIWGGVRTWLLLPGFNRNAITFDVKPDRENMRGDVYELALKICNIRKPIKLFVGVDYKDGSTSYQQKNYSTFC